MHRPAATEQLRTLAKDNGLMAFDPKGEPDAVVGRERVRTRLFGYDVAIVDTRALHRRGPWTRSRASGPRQARRDHNVADAMTGGTPCDRREAFGAKLPAGVILTKTDATRGGAALLLAKVVGAP